MGARVRWYAEGGLLPSFLNALHADGIDLRQVCREKEGISATVRAADYPRLRAAARRTGSRVRIRKKQGLAFYLLRFRRRTGLAAGALAAVCLLLFLSSRIWVVVPSGVSDETACRAVEAVAKWGVFVGAPIEDLALREISLKGLKELEDVIALTVNMDGCVAHVDMVPDESHHPLDVDIKLSNLVAVRDGLILQTEILQGTKMVKVGEGVTAGTLLASGASETTVRPLLGRAEGTVIAQTSRTLSVEIPLKQTHFVPSGDRTVSTSFSFFSLDVPLSAPLSFPTHYRLETDDDFLTVWGIPLPIGFRRTAVTPLVPQTVVYTEEEAAVLAEKRLSEKEGRELAEAVIESCKRESAVTDGVYRLTATYVCRENIAKEVPVTVIGR